MSLIDESKEYTCLLKILKNFPRDTENKNPCETRDIQIETSRLTLQLEWDKLSRVAFQLRGRALNDFNLFYGEFNVTSTLQQFGCLLCGNDGPYDTLAKNLKKEEFRREVEKALEEQGKPAELIDKVLTAFDGEFQNKLRDILKFPLHFIALRSQYAIALGFTGFLAGFHSVYNKQFSHIQVPKFEKNEFEYIKKLIENEDQKYSLRLIEIHSAISLGNRENLRTTAFKILQNQESEMKFLAVITASISKAVTDSILNDLSLARKFASLDLGLGQTVRRWIFTTCVALYANRLTCLPDDKSDFRTEIKNARKLSFNSKVSDGKNVTIKELYENEDEYDGQYLEINGFVKDLEVKRDREKFLTTFSLYEPGRGEEIPVVVLFENMARRGMIETSYVKLHGDWKKQSNVVDYPVLQVERIKLSDRAKESWFDHMLVKLRPWFDYYPNSNHIDWSIRPQELWDDNGKNLNSGAGELIFVEPFSAKGVKNEL